MHPVFLVLGSLAAQAMPAPDPVEMVTPDSLVSFDGRVRPAAERLTVTPPRSATVAEALLPPRRR